LETNRATPEPSALELLTNFKTIITHPLKVPLLELTKLEQ
jgi:hypothetical protein